MSRFISMLILFLAAATLHAANKTQPDLYHGR